jgi:hypothetical protein
LVVPLCLWLAPAVAQPYRNGDIIFQSSTSSQSRAVELATRSPWSHMGMIFLLHGRPYVYEAAEQVKFTPLDQWIARGVDGRFVVMRLRDADRRLSPAVQQRLLAAARHYEGRPYDLYFEWSDRRIYCSELVWKVYQRGLGVKLGQTQRLQEFDLTHPEVRARLRERYGPRVPLNEVVISPAAMYASPLLMKIMEK